jgi:hypothetical protein
MATDAPNDSFDDRFKRFFDECSEDEQRFVAWMLSASPIVAGDGAGEEGPEVEGFVLGADPSFSSQFLQLQDLIGAASAPPVSSIMKTKHDTAKNSISNVR